MFWFSSAETAPAGAEANKAQKTDSKKAINNIFPNVSAKTNAGKNGQTRKWSPIRTSNYFISSPNHGIAAGYL
jgi:membrane protein involved in colicin uptake